MKNGFVKVGAFAPKIKVADTLFNASAIKDSIAIAKENGVEVLVLPELVITGSSCGDLFFSSVLLDGALKALKDICDFTHKKEILVAVGLPLKVDGYIYNVASLIANGKVLGFVPKKSIARLSANADSRYFSSYCGENITVDFYGEKIPFGNNLIFTDKINSLLKIGVEIGTDLYLPCSPSVSHAFNGATVILNLASIPQLVGLEENLRLNVLAHSNKILCSYVLSNAGEGESTSDQVYGGYNIVCENGKLLIENTPFSNKLSVIEIDLSYIDYVKRKNLSSEKCDYAYENISFSINTEKDNLIRKYSKTPFIPRDEKVKKHRAEMILDIQAEGLKKRIEHTNANCVVLGLSGGLDSTLAILVATRAIQKLSRSTKDIYSITMPCFGTTSRTFDNTIKLSKALGVTLKKVDISKAVMRHLKDIKHADGVYDVTFENAQARERTQVLMDIANMNNGLVLGTGDLSEVALGWSTYNGDHMSMYGINCTVPKTLVRHVVEYCAKSSRGKLRAVLEDILATPVSPELLPTENDAISQKTEDIVGPYILHDFFLYNMIRRGYSPEKLYFVACQTFDGDFSKETIKKWLKVFIRRFFNQQFKRSCTPDGVKVGSLCLSPKGDYKMPSDAVSTIWLEQLDNL